MATERPLWNLDRQGTLIFGDHRFGSHFLESVIADTLPVACRKRSVGICHQHQVPANSKTLAAEDIVNRFENLRDPPLYCTLIVNDPFEKIALMTRPDLLDRWHRIRLTHQNKTRWFISHWWYQRHERSGESKLLHHNTPSYVYENYLDSSGLIRFSQADIRSMISLLGDHMLNYAIPVEIEIDYSELEDLQTPSVPWMQNQYPYDRLEDFFTNPHEIQQVLAMWEQIRIPGRFV